jgi:hypothetical protein
MGTKFKVDRPLSDYGDEINKMVNEKSGAPILRLPDDMKEKSCAETAFRLALDRAGETDEAHTKARRIRNDVLNSGKLSFKLSAGDRFSTIAIVHYIDKFQKCFAAIEGGDTNADAVIGAIEAAFAIATLAPPNKRIRKRLAQKAAEAERPGAISPFNVFISECLSRNPNKSAEDVKKAMLRDNDFELSDDDLKIEHIPTNRSLKISGIGYAISKTRKRILKK